MTTLHETNDEQIKNLYNLGYRWYVWGVRNNYIEITQHIMKKIAQRESIRHRTEGRGFNSLSSLFFFEKGGHIDACK